MIVELKLQPKLGYEGSIKWKYIDNVFTRKHQQALIESTNHYIDGWSDHWFHLPLPGTRWDQIVIDGLISEMKATITELNTIWDEKRQERISYPMPLDKIKFIEGKDLENQAILNEIHRYFTTLHQSLGKIDEKRHAWGSYHYTRYDLNNIDQAANKDPNVITKDVFYFAATNSEIKKIRDFSERTNKLVHNLEVYCHTPNKEKIKELNYREFNVEFLPQRWKEFHPIDRKYLSYKEGATVWYTQNQVLGKGYPIAYTDHDDPNGHDIWEGIHYSAAFCFGDRSYSNWKPYREWMESNGLDGIPFGMPLGHIIEGEDKVQTLCPGAIKNIIIHSD